MYVSFEVLHYMGEVQHNCTIHKYPHVSMYNYVFYKFQLSLRMDIMVLKTDWMSEQTDLKLEHMILAAKSL